MQLELQINLPPPLTAYLSNEEEKMNTTRLNT